MKRLLIILGAAVIFTFGTETTTSENSERENLEIYVHPGIITVEEPAITFRGFHNVHYLLNVPNVKPHAVVQKDINMCKDSSKQATEDKRKKSLACDLFTDLEELFHTSKDSVDSLTSSTSYNQLVGLPKVRRGLNFISSIGRGLFGFATDHDVKRVFKDEKDMEERFRSLRFHIEQGDSYDRELAQNFEIWSTNVTESAKYITSKMEGLSLALHKEENIVDSTLALNTQLLAGTISQFLSLTHYIKERLVLKDCENGKIPFQAVNISNFQVYLTNLSQILKPKSHVLAISEREIWKYANEKLASCSFSESYLHVKVAIPVKSTADNWKLFSMSPLYFAYEGQHCRMLTNKKYVLKHMKSHEIIVLNDLYGDKCVHDGLCPIPRIINGDPLSACLSNIVTGKSIKALRETCAFFCDGDEPATRITNIGIDKFSVSSLKKTLNLKCEGFSSTVIPMELGAKTLDLPCNCSLFDGDVPLIGRGYPCKNSVNPANVSNTFMLPALWTSVKFPKSKIFDENGEVISIFKDEVSEAVDPEWKSKIAHLVVPTPSKPLQDKIWYFPEPESTWSWIAISWKILLTLVLICALTKIYFMAKSYQTFRSNLRAAVERREVPLLAM